MPDRLLDLDGHAWTVGSGADGPGARRATASGTSRLAITPLQRLPPFPARQATNKPSRFTDSRILSRLPPLDRERVHRLQQHHGITHRLSADAVREQLRSPLGDRRGRIASSRRRPKRGPRRRSEMRSNSRSVDRAGRLSASARYMGQNPASVRPEPASAARTRAARGLTARLTAGPSAGLPKRRRGRLLMRGRATRERLLAVHPM
jgi:hypothetical protein